MINAKIKIHIGAARVIKKVDRKTAAKWKRVRHRKLCISGLTRVIVHSDLLLLTKNQRKEWYRIETEKRNPVIMAIHEAIRNCYRFPKE